MKKLLQQIKRDHEFISFIEGDHFFWSPKNKSITYSFTSQEDQEITLLHELAHAVLEHSSFTTDFELLLLEVQAWTKADELGNKYGVKVPQEHVDKCLDTYRDWLHARSTCPSCTSNGLQSKRTRTYECINCVATWDVSESRLCRPYRQLTKLKNT